MSNRSASKFKKSLEDLLTELGVNTKHDSLVETAERFQKQIRECLVGYNDDPKKHLNFFKNDNYKDLVVISKISFGSLCEHHLLPFFGYVDIGYLPSDKILGLSKFARIIDAFSKRLQVQERLTEQLINFLNRHLKPKLIMVRVVSSHTCMTIRGVSRPESLIETYSIIGNNNTNQKHIDYFNQIGRR